MPRNTSPRNSQNYPGNKSNNRLTLVAGLLAAGLSVPALFAQSAPFPIYTVGKQADGNYVVSDGAIISPVGTQVDLGIRVRAKAVVVNPLNNGTAAVLTMGTSPSNGNGVIGVISTITGKIIQWYNPAGGKDSSGSHAGLAYTPDGKHLLFSQDDNFVTLANVDPKTGLLSDNTQVSVPIDGTQFTILGQNFDWTVNTVNCFPNSVPGTDGSYAHACGHTEGTGSSYPLGIAVSPDGKTAYAVLDVNDTLAKIDLTAATPVEGAQVRVGNLPHSVVVSPDGATAYVSNEGGRVATANDTQQYSAGTNVVADPFTGSTSTGSVSVVDLASFTVKATIPTGLHPTGMAFYGKYLLVSNTYDDTVSVIDTTSNKVVELVYLPLPVKVPGTSYQADGANPNSIAVDAASGFAYVALYGANAVSVLDLRSIPNAVYVKGMIPVAYAPSSVAISPTQNALVIANDKGIGARNSLGTEFGATSYNTHQDNGTVTIVAYPSPEKLALWTNWVYQNNHWDLTENINTAAGGSKTTPPVAIPAKIGDPSLIKHVFLIIRENRTYDQILGDVAAGNGDASLATFGAGVTPNAHALVTRFPLLDNFYNPSRQSADGHNWIVQARAPYSDDIQSPDWVRDYPSNGGDVIAYQKTGHLWDAAARAGVSYKNYGEYIEYNTFTVPGCTATSTAGGLYPLVPGFSGSCHPTWSQFYADTQAYESGAEPQLKYFNTVGSHSPLPNLIKNTVQNYPQFDLDIPDQFRVDVWEQDFANDVKKGTVPQLETLWISSDHTGGPPTAVAMQADNDLAVGRYVDIISHSSIWNSSVIFIEEDDAQTGVDHVDGHRSPGYVISPYVVQGGAADHTYYSQVNFTRTIEQILGLQPMNANDLVASPVRTLFTDYPPEDNFAPWTHVANIIPLDQGVGNAAQLLDNLATPQARALAVGWMKMKKQVFAGKHAKPDAEDPDTVNHLLWYEATGFVRPFPGESKVRPASDFKHRKAPAGDQDDD